jgi:hypothetical protein
MLKVGSGKETAEKPVLGSGTNCFGSSEVVQNLSRSVFFYSTTIFLDQLVFFDVFLLLQLCFEFSVSNTGM